MDLFTVLLGLAIVATLGAIIWAIMRPNKKPIDVDAGDVTLLAVGMEDPMLGVAAWTAAEGAGDDLGDLDLVMDTGEDVADVVVDTPTGPTEEVWSHVETPAPAPEPDSAAKEVWTHVETPTPEPVHESHHSSDYGSSGSSYSSDYSSSSYDSGSSGGCDSGGGGDGGGGGGD
jgi:uncharacterized membrane protein YgcG